MSKKGLKIEEARKLPFFSYDLRFWNDLKTGYVGSIVIGSVRELTPAHFTIFDALVFKRVKFMGVEQGFKSFNAIFEVVFDEFYSYDDKSGVFKPFDTKGQIKPGSIVQYPANLVRPMFIKEWNQFELIYGKK